MRHGLIITVRLLRSSQIEMSSPMPFVWVVLHFYHPHMEPVWPEHSRTGCMPPLNSQPFGYLPQKRWLHVTHIGHATTRVLPHSISSLQLTFCFVSVHLLLIRQLLVHDFSQTLAVSRLHMNSANGLSLNRLSGENRIHMGTVIENVWFVMIWWWGVTSKQKEYTLQQNSWNFVVKVGRTMAACLYLLLIHKYICVAINHNWLEKVIFNCTCTKRQHLCQNMNGLKCCIELKWPHIFQFIASIWI